MELYAPSETEAEQMFDQLWIVSALLWTGRQLEQSVGKTPKKPPRKTQPVTPIPTSHHPRDRQPGDCLRFHTACGHPARPSPVSTTFQRNTSRGASSNRVAVASYSVSTTFQRNTSRGLLTNAVCGVQRYTHCPTAIWEFEPMVRPDWHQALGNRIAGRTMRLTLNALAHRYGSGRT